MHGGRTMGKYSEAFVAFDVAKKKHAVAIAEGGRAREVRFLGDMENSWLPIERTIKRLADRYDRLHVCFEAGPTGYGLYRQIQALGHDCMVVAPAPIPKRPGERIKTNRRDAVTLARLHRAGRIDVWRSPNAPFRVRGTAGEVPTHAEAAAGMRGVAQAGNEGRRIVEQSPVYSQRGAASSASPRFESYEAALSSLWDHVWTAGGAWCRPSRP